MYDGYHVIGLQRTGTNWLNQLIQHNFDIKPVTEGFWKHLTPLGGRWERRRKYLHWGWRKEDLVLQPNVFYIATSKNFELWKRSLERNAEDFSITQPNVRLNPEYTEVIYDSWHEWKDSHKFTHNFYYRNYMDWLNNWETRLHDIHLKTGWTRKHKEYQNVDRVPQSPNFKIENYIMKEK